jgi:molybdopterin molybdotransferase
LTAPGQDLSEGGIYASNSVNIRAWLSLLNIPSVAATVGDDAVSIGACLEGLLGQADGVITSGGLMHSERDLVVGVLNELGWQVLFRHVRMGPGKGTSFGVWRDRPVFCLSGGPTSSATGFLEIALPGIFRMTGLPDAQLARASARLTRDIRGRSPAWTEFRQARLAYDTKGRLLATPLSEASRSRSMADADCLLCKPEGVDSLRRGQMVTVHLLSPFCTAATTGDPTVGQEEPSSR